MEKPVHVSTVIFFLILLGVCVTFSFSQPVENLKNGVVKVRAATREGREKVGTGYVVQKEADAVYIVTASHVVEGARTVDVEFFTRRNRLVQAQVLHIEGGDPRGLAVLLVEKNVPPEVLVLKLTRSILVQDGDSVITIGFPRMTGVSWATIMGNIVGISGRAITVSGPIEEGNSGGPLVKEGQVIGVVTEVNPPFAYAVPAIIAQYILESWGIKLPEGSPDPKELIKNGKFKEFYQPAWNAQINHRNASIEQPNSFVSISFNGEGADSKAVEFYQVVNVSDPTGLSLNLHVKISDSDNEGFPVGVLTFMDHSDEEIFQMVFTYDKHYKPKAHDYLYPVHNGVLEGIKISPLEYARKRLPLDTYKKATKAKISFYIAVPSGYRCRKCTIEVHYVSLMGR